MSERGAADTSMRQLAAACGVNVAILYRYFPSKADLLRSVIEERQYEMLQHKKSVNEADAIDVTPPPADAPPPPQVAQGQTQQQPAAPVQQNQEVKQG